MPNKTTLKDIKKMHELNPQYLRLGCLSDNIYKETCEKCYESKKTCKEMLEAFKYPPYNITIKDIS